MERVANINQHFSSRETMGAVCEEEGGGRREGGERGGVRDGWSEEGGKERNGGRQGGGREGCTSYIHVHVSTMVAYERYEHTHVRGEHLT